MDEVEARADWNVWRKRITQTPLLAFNPRTWTIGIAWGELAGDALVIHIFCFGLIWDMWP